MLHNFQITYPNGTNQIFPYRQKQYLLKTHYYEIYFKFLVDFFCCLLLDYFELCVAQLLPCKHQLKYKSYLPKAYVFFYLFKKVSKNHAKNGDHISQPQLSSVPSFGHVGAKSLF